MNDSPAFTQLERAMHDEVYKDSDNNSTVDVSNHTIVLNKLGDDDLELDEIPDSTPQIAPDCDSLSTFESNGVMDKGHL